MINDKVKLYNNIFYKLFKLFIARKIKKAEIKVK